MGIRSDIANTYWHHFLGFPKYLPNPEEPTKISKADFSGARALDGEILPPEPRPDIATSERTPEEIFIELRAMKIEPRGTRALARPVPEPDRGIDLEP